MIGSIKNWKKFQHFKNRRPPWIKLYRDILDDPEWHSLSGESAKALVMLWLIASESNGYLPDIKAISFRLRISDDICKSLIDKLKHWLDINMISTRYQDDTPEGEREGEKETEKESPLTPQIKKPEDPAIAYLHNAPTIPKSLDTENFRQAWDEWLQDLSQRRPPIIPTPGMIRGQLTNLEAMGPQKAIEAINNAISGGWRQPGLKNELSSKPARDDYTDEEREEKESKRFAKCKEEFKKNHEGPPEKHKDFIAFYQQYRKDHPV